MNRTSLVLSTLITLAMGVAPLTHASTDTTNTLNLSNVPIGAGSLEKGKIYFLIDDSGSMDWETLIEPSAYTAAAYKNKTTETYADSEGHNFDWPGENQTDRTAAVNDDWRTVCACFNKVYFDPKYDYTNEGTVTSEWNSTDYKPFYFSVWAEDNKKMINNISPSSGMTGGANGVIDWHDRHYVFEVRSNKIIKRTYKVSNSGIRSLVSTNSTYNPSGDFGVSANELRLRIGTWFHTSRTRDMVAKRAVTKVIAKHERHFVFGVRSTNGSITQVDPEVSDSNDLTALKAHNNDVRNKYILNTDARNGRTPLRRGLYNVGDYFKTDANAFDSACQKVFSMTFTDGFWNSTNFPSGSVIKDADGDGHNATFADVAHYFHKNDLKTGGSWANNVTPSLNDPANWQHMASYIVTLGIEGKMTAEGISPFPEKDRDGTNIKITNRNYDSNWGDPQPGGGRGVAGPERVDDMWHAAYNGHGQYLSASTAREAENQLLRAVDAALVESQSFPDEDILSGIDIGKVGDTEVIVTSTFNPAYWTGNVRAQEIKADGKVKSSVLWDAVDTFNSGIFNNVFTVIHPGTRDEKLVRLKMPADMKNPADNELSSELVEFIAADYRDRKLSSEHGTLSPAEVVTNFTNEVKDYGRHLTAYLKGRTTQEGIMFRERKEVLGDIIKSAPIFVAKASRHYPSVWTGGPNVPENQATAQAYSDFVTDTISREPMVYFGSNDGFLHAIKGVDGKRVFSFVPDFLFEKLLTTAHDPYVHKYFNDGGIAINDVFDGRKWKTVLVANAGFGAQGLYALDITDPSHIKFLWSKTDADYRGIGYSDGTPLISRLHNNKWGVLIGNGFNNNADDGHRSGSGKSHAFLLDVMTGEKILRLDGTKGFDDTPQAILEEHGGRIANATTRPTFVDINHDKVADYVYFGDLYGYLWRFDISDKSQFTQANNSMEGTEVFQTIDARPILTRPEVSAHPYHNPSSDKTSDHHLIVYFGTGRMATFEDADPGTQSKAQRFYAIYDKLNDDSDLPLSKSDLTEKEITKQNTNHGYRKVNHHKRSLVEPSTTPSHKDRGWYLTLKKPGSKHNGERVIVSPVYRNGMIMFTTTFPSAGSACSTAYAEGYMMILDSKTGNNVLDLEVGENDVRVVAGQTISTGTSAFSNLRAKGGYTESDKLYHSKEDNGTIQDMSLGSRMMYNRSSWRVLD